MTILPIIKVIMFIAFVHGDSPVLTDIFPTTLLNCNQIIVKADRFNATHPGADKILAFCNFRKSQMV